MARASRLLLRAAAASIAIAAASGSALACRCVDPTPAAAYRGAELVVRARVAKVSGDPEGPGGAVARLTVAQSWKGAVTGEIEVATSTTCAYPFEAGQELLVYLQRGTGAAAWSTRRCRGNRPLAEAAGALDWLSRYGKPTPSSPPAR